MVKYYALQLIQAVAAIHSSDVCHRDIKLDNVVLNTNFDLKLTDFGLACELSGQDGSGFCNKGLD